MSKKPDEESGLVDKGKDEDHGISCAGYLIYVPLVLLGFFISVFFWLLWLILLPTKCCCCTCFLDCIAWLAKVAAELPVNLGKWGVRTCCRA